MRPSVLAFLVLAGLTVPAAPAAGQPSRDCAALEAEHRRLQREAQTLEDEVGAMTLALRFYSTAHPAIGETKEQLEKRLRRMDLTLAAWMEVRDHNPDDNRVREARASILMLEKWSDVLREFIVARSLGQSIDPRDNALTRWRARIDRRLPRLQALLPSSRSAAAAAELAALRCVSGGEPPPPADRTRAFRTTLGEARLVVDGGSVSGSYDYETGGRFVGGPPANYTPPPGFKLRGGNVWGIGKVYGSRSGDVAEGFWVQPSGRSPCPRPREGSPHWGRFRWEMKANGGWRGMRGSCDGPLSESWDGDPK